MKRLTKIIKNIFWEYDRFEFDEVTEGIRKQNPDLYKWALGNKLSEKTGNRLAEKEKKE